MPTSVRSSIARAREAFSSMFKWMVSGSVICRPILSTGLSEVIGSWKIMAISRPRMRRISSSVSPRSWRPPKRIEPAGARRAGGQQLHDGQRRYRLAGARLADDRHHLAGVDGVAQGLDGSHRAVRGVEPHVQVLDLEQGFAASRKRGRRRRFSQRHTFEGRDDLVIQLVPPLRGTAPFATVHARPPAACRMPAPLANPQRRATARGQAKCRDFALNGAAHGGPSLEVHGRCAPHAGTRPLGYVGL